jgi:acetyl esterase
LRARDADGPRLAFQLLLYPVLDHDFGRDSYRSATFPLRAEDMRWFWDHYLPRPEQRDRPDASPLRATTLAGLPSTHLVLAGDDPLHDEGAAYAAALRASGVPVTVDEHGSLCHGFHRLTGVCAAARAAVPAIIAAARDRFAAAG